MRALALLLLVACESASPPQPKPPDLLQGVELPVITGAGYEPAVATMPIVVGRHDGLAVGDKSLMGIKDGDVEPAEKQGGAMGMKIPRLSTILGATARAPRLVVALDKRLSYRLFIEVLYSAKQKEAGWKDFVVLAKANTKVVGVPISLPDRSAASAESLGGHLASVGRDDPEPAASDDQPLLMFVSLTRDRALLWSATGLEGTLHEPKLALDASDPKALDKLSAALADIVMRHWGGKPRPAGTTPIVIQADGAVPMQRIAETIGAVRMTADGKPLFPDIQLSWGFE